MTAECIRLLADIERLIGRYEGQHRPRPAPMLRKSLRVRSVQGSVAIEGNTLTDEQITAVLEGRRVTGPRREIREVKNALAAYDRLSGWNANEPNDLLAAHKVLMSGLIESAGSWRRGNIGVLDGSRVAHVAPPAERVAWQVENLLQFLAAGQATHPIVKAAVVHYELEFIHPFEDGNGRIGRLWHTLILSEYHTVFAYVPVESIIRDQQSDYYAVLRQCDRAGNSTAFVEFSLLATKRALDETLTQLIAKPVTAADRLAVARERFQNSEFARKDYLPLFPGLSTATASRDLRQAVDSGRLQRSGQKSQTTYAFRVSR
jgi:Fic family protein